MGQEFSGHAHLDMSRHGLVEGIVQTPTEPPRDWSYSCQELAVSDGQVPDAGGTHGNTGRVKPRLQWATKLNKKIGLLPQATAQKPKNKVDAIGSESSQHLRENLPYHLSRVMADLLSGTHSFNEGLEC